MGNYSDIKVLSKETESILFPPFEWCPVEGGMVRLADAVQDGGTPGGDYSVADFTIAKYLVTNAQYQKFLADPHGFAHPGWWEFSAEAAQWHKDRPNPKPTAFEGADLPRTRVSWFDSLAFCAWLSSKLDSREVDIQNPLTWSVCLPTEQEWQRAAIGDTGWRYTWGDELDKTRANYTNHVGQPSPVGSFPAGKSPYGALDMVGNLWEWCLTPWGAEGEDVHGYTYRLIKGGAWNVSNPDHLCVTDRYGHPPRGRLNDCGFRCVLHF
jgi:formylglycine-generating enzyme required for sulfatase activity